MLGHWLWQHIKPLLVLGEVKRPWGFLAIAALSVGLPVLIGASLDQFAAATTASMGALVILHMQQTRISHRMMVLAVCSFGFAACFALGVLTSFNIYLSVATLAISVFLITMICGFFSVPAPGNFFFILIACLARTLPFDLTLAAERTGILLFGCIGACLLAFVYSVFQVHVIKDRVLSPIEAPDLRVAAIALEAAVVAIFVAGGYLFALLMAFENPYWVPVSTAAIMQGATFRAVWQRNVHRIVGTLFGMGLVWLIFSFSPSDLSLALLVVALTFMIEALVTRNYGLAVVFITPLTVIYSDASMASGQTEQLITARLLDIMFGSAVGYVGGWVMYHPRLFVSLERLLSRH